MPDLPAGDLIWVACAAIVAGIVRGFAGFGTGMIYIPLAALSLPPIWALITLTIMDLLGPLPNIPAALRDGRPRQVAGLGLAAALGLLPGLWALDRLNPDSFRWVVGLLCLATVALMASGWRWTGRMSPPVTLATGAISGFLGGISGLAGPPVILAYMAAPLPAATIRANIMLYLVVWDALFGAMLFATGRLTADPLILGAALIPPYLFANILGARLFRPARGVAYRAVAYAIIVAAALLALPIGSFP